MEIRPFWAHAPSIANRLFSKATAGAGLAVILAALSLLVPEPIVFPWRQTVSALLVMLALAAAAAWGAGRCRRTALVLAAVAVLPVWMTLPPWLARRDVLGRSGPATAEIERHFIVGYTDIETARELVGRAEVGGIFLTRRNVAGRSKEEIAAEVAGLQAIRHKAGLPALIVAADQEGGPVSHLSPPLPKPPALSTLSMLSDADQAKAATQLGREMGAQLKELGVTMDFAPVADLTPANGTGIFDLNTRIASRSISGDPAITARIAAGFAEGLLAARVTPTAKHFPGLGRVTTDTHLFGASLDAGAQALETTDWVPFKAVLAVPGAAIMLSHVALSDLDAGTPASQSRRTVTDLLRTGWGFTGIAITDDLGMGAVEHAGLCRAVERALNAGVDFLLVSWDTDKVYPALRCALDAQRAGRLDRGMLDRSALRIQASSATRRCPEISGGRPSTAP